MTIGIDGSRAFIEGKTGTENYSYQIIKNLSSIDLKNNYLIYIKKSQVSNLKSQMWPQNFQFKIIDLPRLWTQIGLALRTFIDPIDVLFVPSHTLPLIKRPGLKTVVTVHDLGAEYLPALHQLKQVLYLNIMTHYQLKSADRIIAVSEATKADLINRVQIRKNKVSVVYEAADEKVFNKISTDSLQYVLRHFKLQKNKYFLFVGTIQPRKNLEKIIEAFKVFSESTLGYDLVLAGGKGWKSDAIYDLPQKLGIGQEVRFIGRVTDEELRALYNGATGLVYPSLFEGFGLPIVEAFNCGCPVITSKISSMPEVAGDSAILVDPYNKEEIAEALGSLASKDTLRSSLIKKGYLRSKFFSWRKAAIDTLEVIKSTYLL